jgi:hypothetical protein
MSRSFDHNAPRGSGNDKRAQASRKQRRPEIAYQAMRNTTPRLTQADLHRLVGFNWRGNGADE